MLRKILVTATVFLMAYIFAGPAQASVGLDQGRHQEQTKLTEWHVWQITGNCNIPVGSNGESAHKAKLNCDTAWPQAHVTAGTNFTAQCGVWYQVDKYYGTRGDIDAVVADGSLTFKNGKAEDSNIVQDWYFKFGGTCDTPKPEDKVVYSDWKDGEWACNDTTVTQTRTKTVTSYKKVDGQWVLDSDNAVVTTETKTRTLADREKKNCYVIVAWQMPSWKDSSHPTWPQKYVTSQKQTTKDLSTLDDYLDDIGYGCYQVDLYYDDATTTSLIAGGVLNGPNNPTEHLVPGTSWKLVKVGKSCDPPPVKVCVDNHKKTIPFAEYNANPSAYTLYDQNCERPDDKVVKGEWTDGIWTCNDTSVEQTRMKTVTPYVKVNGTWVLDTANAVVTYETRTRQLSEREQTHCYVIVAWKMPSWINDHTATWPQTIVTHEKQSTPDLTALDDDLNAIGYGCYQVDIYYDDTTTANLVAGGVLYSPQNPTEHLIPGGWGTAYKVVKIGNSCEPPKVDVCVYENGQAKKVTIWESDFKDGDIRWVNGNECTPPTSYCVYEDGQAKELSVPAGQTPPQGAPRWVNGNECTPPTSYCVYTQGDDLGHEVVVPAGQTPPPNAPKYVDGSECTPPLNIDLSTSQPICIDNAPYIHIQVVQTDPGGRSTGGDTITVVFFDDNEHALPPMTVDLEDDLSADILWPGAEVTGGVATGWPGWELQDGVWVNVGDENFGWTRHDAQMTVTYNPSKTFALAYPEATWECGNPPPADYCVYTQGDATGHKVTVEAGGQIPAGAKPWTGNGADCAPDVCPNIQGQQVSLPTDLKFYTINDEVKCGKDPTLAGTIVSSVCKADVPWIFYSIQLNDPYGVSTNTTGKAKFTFTAKNSAEKYEKEVPIGTGKFLWPGASAKNLGGGKYEATGWPGWALVDGEWESVGNDNYGWTRNGVSVLVEVNPTMTVNLAYPPPTKLCVAGPPTEVHNQLDAPPADAVEAEAQYAG